jgi:hypothetical protein
MTAVSKKSRIITRSRYRCTDLLRQEKWRRSSSRNYKPGVRVASICQRVEDNGFHQSPVDRLFLKMPVRLGPRAKQFAEGARLIFANCVYPTARKTPPSGRPGQVKAPDGVSPQPQDRQRLACLLQACVVLVLNFACNHAPLNAQRRTNCVSRLRCVFILVGIVLVLFVRICPRRDHG